MLEAYKFVELLNAGTQLEAKPIWEMLLVAQFPAAFRQLFRNKIF
jgi:hypothetical protein